MADFQTSVSGKSGDFGEKGKVFHTRGRGKVFHTRGRGEGVSYQGTGGKVFHTRGRGKVFHTRGRGEGVSYWRSHSQTMRVGRSVTDHIDHHGVNNISIIVV